MALTIVATAGSASANSFVELAEAESYMESRLNGDSWTAASLDTKNRALVEATRELSPKAWVGTQASSAQALAWPRWYAENPDAGLGACYYDSTIIPQRVKDATCELAFQFVNAGSSDIASADPNAGVILKTADVLTTQWENSNSKPTGMQRYPRVLQLIQPLLTGSGSSVPLIRG